MRADDASAATCSSCQTRRSSAIPKSPRETNRKKPTSGRRAKLADHAERVEALLAATPDLTIAELRTRLAAAGLAVSPAAISRFLEGLRG